MIPCGDGGVAAPGQQGTRQQPQNRTDRKQGKAWSVGMSARSMAKIALSG
jgi:hypothetical protein